MTRKTDDTLGVCAGDVEPDNEHMEIEMEAGMRRPDRKAAPEEPTAQERAEHMLARMPFRSWCRHCVRGRGKEEPCRQGQGDPEYPEVHMDYMFMGEETGGKTLAVLAAKDRSSGEFVSKRVEASMGELGCEMSMATLKTDNGPALVAVTDAVTKVRASRFAQRTIMENSPAHFSKSNGVIERGVQTIQGMVRTLRSAIEERWMVKLDPENALLSWLVEYAGWLVNRAEVGHDGQTPYERLKGKTARLPGMEFGEAVMWKSRPQGGPLGKLSCLWSDGIYFRVKGSTGEYIVGDGAGVWKTRTVRRKIESERWNKDTIKLVGGVPWKVNPQDPTSTEKG